MYSDTWWLDGDAQVRGWASTTNGWFSSESRNHGREPNPMREWNAARWDSGVAGASGTKCVHRWQTNWWEDRRSGCITSEGGWNKWNAGDIDVKNKETNWDSGKVGRESIRWDSCMREIGSAWRGRSLPPPGKENDHLKERPIQLPKQWDATSWTYYSDNNVNKEETRHILDIDGLKSSNKQCKEDEAMCAPWQSSSQGVNQTSIHDPTQIVHASRRSSFGKTQETKNIQMTNTMDVQRRIWTPGSWQHAHAENIENIELARPNSEGNNVEQGTVDKLVDIVGLLLQSQIPGEANGEGLADEIKSPKMTPSSSPYKDCIGAYSPPSVPQSYYQSHSQCAIGYQSTKPRRHTDCPKSHVLHQAESYRRLSLPAMNHQVPATDQISCYQAPLPSWRNSSNTLPSQSTAPLMSATASSGVAWDWPLSRYEKKERIKMIEEHVSLIDQTKLMQENGKLLDQIEELRGNYAKKCFEGSGCERWERI